MDLQDLKTDLDAAEEGVFFPFGEDCRIKIASWNNPGHLKFLRSVYQKHGRKIDAGALSDAQADELMRPQWSFIIKDWEGLTEGGETLDFSSETLLSLVANPQYKAFFDKIASIAKEEENFRVQNIQDLGESLPIT